MRHSCRSSRSSGSGKFATVSSSWSTATPNPRCRASCASASTPRSWHNQHRVGGSPLDCANKVADWAAICDFLQVYYTWNGSEFVQLDGLPGDPFDPTTWLNVAPLLEAVQDAVPRAEAG